MTNIKDVAKAAKVSVGTVSRAFNGYQDIKEETRDRILSIAKEMNYVPNKSAVDLVRGTKPTIGLVLHKLGEQNIFDEFGLRIISGVYNRARAFGYDINFFTIDAIKEQNLSFNDFLRYHNLVGTIIHGLDLEDPYLDSLASSNEPTVLIDKTISASKKMGTVTTDNFVACYDVARRLVSLGHTKILFIAGSDKAEVSKIRENGFYSYFTDSNVETKDIKLIRCDFNEWQTYGIVHELFSVNQEYTAIFASSDLMALGAYRALSDLGYKIGDDISIIGFDGLSAMRYTRPALSTVEQDFYKMGESSVDLLLKLEDDTATMNNILIPYNIKITSSCVKNRKLEVE